MDSPLYVEYLRKKTMQNVNGTYIIVKIILKYFTLKLIFFLPY